MPGATVYEIDAPMVLAFKDSVLAGQGAVPRCDRRTVAADLPIVLPNPRNQITTRALPQYLDYRARLLAQLFADEGLVATEPA